MKDELKVSYVSLRGKVGASFLLLEDLGTTTVVSSNLATLFSPFRNPIQKPT